MKTVKSLGIWMDHSSAHLTEYSKEAAESQTIESAFTHEVKEQSLSKGEHLANNKEQHQHAAYYKKLGEIIKNYDDVVLFGPTDAKVELYNLLKEDHHFEKINIEVANADKMTENQQHAFVKAHFSN